MLRMTAIFVSLFVWSATRHQSLLAWAISTNLVVYASSLLEGNVMEEAVRRIHLLPVDPLCKGLCELVVSQTVVLVFARAKPAL